MDEQPVVVPAPPKVSRLAAAITGVVVAVAGLGVAELVASATRRWKSPVLEVGDRVIDLVPRWAKDFAIRTFGTNDKLALLIGIGTILAIYAAVMGVVALRHRLAVGVGMAAAFGVLGAWAATQARTNPPLHVAVPSLCGGVAAALALAVIARAGQLPDAPATAVPATPLPALPEDVVDAPPASPRPARAGMNRRQLLAGGATAVIGVALYGLGRQFAARFDAAASRAKVLLPQALRPLDAVDPAAQATGAVPFFTPNSDFYRIDINLSVPNIDPDDWSLRVHGLVDGERRYSYADLLARDLVEADITLTCVSNEVGGRLMGTARWLGVPLQELLDEAGVRPDADYVVGRSFDGFTAGFPLGVLDGRAALLAVGMNGEPLPLIHGFPARLVVPGVYGYSSATKWITEIELTRLDDAPTYWVERGWSVEAPIKTSSRIDTPAGLASVPRGLVAVAGVAWSQPVGISRVEVRVDDGPWERATLAAEVNGSTWRQWSFPWQASAGRHTLTVRATDNNGAIQIEERSEPFPSGVTGWHQIVVLVA